MRFDPAPCLLLSFAIAACSAGTGGTVQFSASGEVLALGGYAFPPATPNDAAFVDGWEIHFDKLLVTVDHVTLSNGPDSSPTDQSRTGAVVARVDGPWAIDLHKGGSLVGKGGADEQALPITTVDGQNQNGGRPFDDSTRYAFGFDLAAATATATRLNIDAADPDYAEMIAQGYTVLYVGTATFRGSGCTSTNPAFDFSRLPAQVSFRFGFRSPTTYVNCQNPDNDPATPFGDEEHERGVQIRSNAVTIAQVTVHTDHPFWESFVHDSPVHFDQLAALATADGAGVYHVTTDSAVGVDYTAFRFGANPLPWRRCLSSYTPPNSATQMGFDSLTIPHALGGDPKRVMRDYVDYLTYNQSTQGHLNSDGLCFVQRHYPSPN
jgi:hypothetical protein